MSFVVVYIQDDTHDQPDSSIVDNKQIESLNDSRISKYKCDPVIIKIKTLPVAKSLLIVNIGSTYAQLQEKYSIQNRVV